MKSLLLVVLVVLCGKIECQNISTALTDVNCTEFLSALETSGVLSTLEGLGNVTLFAPTNDAIGAFPPPPDQLKTVLEYHAIEKRILAADIENDVTETSINGTQIRFNTYNTRTIVTAQGASIDLDHVDVDSGNGYIHVIDAVMGPPSGTIYEFISSNDDFSQLKDAIDRAELNGTLDGTDPYTVFAPNNAAFDNVPQDELDALLADKDALTAVLQYHGIAGTHYTVDLNNGDVFDSLQEDQLRIVIDGTNTYINDTTYAQLTSFDASVTNGVIHTVNRVLKVGVITSGCTTTSIQTSIIISCLALLVTVFKH